MRRHLGVNKRTRRMRDSTRNSTDRLTTLLRSTLTLFWHSNPQHPLLGRSFYQLVNLRGIKRVDFNDD